MSENESHHHGKHEIIIVKKHGGHDHGHHGGAWKIAYADFMTAMMAFFLVMWLINAANEETKAAVASYFNPIKLTDSKPSEKGLKKQAQEKEGQEAEDKSKTKTDAQQNSKGETAKTGQQETTTAGEKTSYSEADYFENPYAVLSEIVLEVGEQANISKKGEGGAGDAGPATGADGGEAFRDPFDPDFWTQQVEVLDARSSDTMEGNEGPGGFPDIAKNGEGDETDIGAPPADDPANVDLAETKGGAKVAQQSGTGEMAQAAKGSSSSAEMPDQVDLAGMNGGQSAAQSNEGNQTAQTSGGKPLSDDEKALQEAIRQAEMADKKDHSGQQPDGDVNAGLQADGEKQPGSAEVASLDPKGAEQQRMQQQQAAQALKTQLQKAIGGEAGLLADGLTVTPAEGGLLISVSDQTEAPMFDVGSAVPRRDTVLAMEKIGQVLASRRGRIVIRGHTDALPYKNGAGDNWTLSVNRARSAYYMLIKGGLDEKRVAQVAGYADRRPAVVGDPLNPKNRRIEILVESGTASGG